jgi:endonuclease YncB( thermonuclease family)
VSEASPALAPGSRPRNRGASLRDLVRFLARNVLITLSLVLLCASAFFFVSAERFRRSIRKRQTDYFNTGDAVRITRVIDGDEVVVVGAEKRQTVVRLLGIKSFDPTRHDPLLSHYGTICVDYIKSNYLGREARLKIGRTRTDKHGRLLAHLELGKEDVGLTLVERGLTLVYNRYDFSRMEKYAQAEVAAMNAKTGLWSNTGVSARAQALKAVWDEERSRDD